MKFFKILAASVLTLSLAACGGGGGGASGTGSTTATSGSIGNNNGNGSTGGNTGNVLFVGDYGNHAFAAFTTLTPAAGSSISANVLGTNGLTMWNGLALDAEHDRLYSSAGLQIAVFEHASALNGIITPTRLITPKMDYSSLWDMVLDKVHDRLYVKYNVGLGGAIAVFDNISTLSGTVAPTRRIDRMLGYDYMVDFRRNTLYVLGWSHDQLYTYPNADQINGFLPIVTPVKLAALTNKDVRGLSLDEQHDRLYMGVPGVGIAMLDQASTGASQVNFVSLPNQATHSGVAYDAAHDRLYAGLDNQVYIFNSASSLAPGNSSSATQISAPAGSMITTFAF